MMCEHATMEGLMHYAGPVAAVEIGDRVGAHNLPRMLGECEARVRACIIPNTPDAAPGAFLRAVYAQFVHENSEGAGKAFDLPDGVKSFTVNGFSATFGDGAGKAINLCDTARAVLLEAGLMYRGVLK